MPPRLPTTTNSPSADAGLDLDHLGRLQPELHPPSFHETVASDHKDARFVPHGERLHGNRKRVFAFMKDQPYGSEHPGLEAAILIWNIDLRLHGARRTIHLREKNGQSCHSILHERINAEFDGAAHADHGNTDSGAGNTRRSTLSCASWTRGMDCVLEAVPAWMSEPGSANRLVIIPSNGAVIDA